MSRIPSAHRSPRSFALAGTTAVLAVLNAPGIATAQEGQAVGATDSDVAIIQNGPITQPAPGSLAGIVGAVLVTNGDERTLSITSVGDIDLAPNTAAAGIAGVTTSAFLASSQRRTIIDHTGNIEIAGPVVSGAPQPQIGPTLNGVVGIIADSNDLFPLVFEPNSGNFIFVEDPADIDIDVAGDITATGEFAEGIRAGATGQISIDQIGNTTSGEHGIRIFGSTATTVNIVGDVIAGTAGRVQTSQSSRNLVNGTVEFFNDTFDVGDGIEIRGGGAFDPFGQPIPVGEVSVNVDGNITSAGRGVDILAEGNIALEISGTVTTTGSGTSDINTFSGPNNIGTRTESFGLTGIEIDSQIFRFNANTSEPEFFGGEVVANIDAAINTTGDGVRIFSANDTTLNVRGGITTSEMNAEGIGIIAAHGDVNVSSSGEIATAGEGSEGIQVFSTFFSNDDDSLPENTVNIIVEHDGDIDAGSDGIELETHRGDVSLTHNGDVNVRGPNGEGVDVGVAFFNPANTGENLSIGNATVNSTGNITTNGDNSEGIRVSAGTGNATLVHVGDITTSGTRAEAVQVSVENIAFGNVDTGTGDASATVTGNIAVTGGDANTRGGIGLFVGSAIGDATANLTGSFNVSEDQGILVRTQRGDASANVALNAASSATTSGLRVVTADGDASSTLSVQDSFVVSDGDAVSLQGDTARLEAEISSDGSITSSRRAIDVLASAGGASVAVQNAGLIEGSDAVSVAASSGTVEVTNDGTIRGDIETGRTRFFIDPTVVPIEIISDTRDTITNRNTIDGAIATGTNDDTLTLAAGSTLTGNADLGAGNDTATATVDSFDGILDGGDDTDALTLAGGGAVALNRIVNFEDTALTGGSFSAQGVGSGPLIVRDDASLSVAAAATTGALRNEGNVEVTDGATLSTDSFTAASGSTTGIGLSPASNGTIASTGAVSFLTGSTLALAVTSDADIADGSTFTVATGSSVADASTLTDDSSLFDFIASVTGGNSLVLTAERALLFADNGPEGSELQSVGTSLDQAIESDGQLRAIIDSAILSGATEDGVLADLTPTDSFAEIGATRAATAKRSAVIFDRITGRLPSGQVNAIKRPSKSSPDSIAVSTSVATSPAFAAATKTKGPKGRRVGLWAKGFAGVAEQDSSAASSGFDADSFGIAAGIDYAVSPGVVVGVAGSYGSTDADLTGASAGEILEVDSLSGILYGGVERGPLLLEGQAFYGENDYEGTASILGNSVTSDYDGNEYGVALRASYSIDTGNGVSVAPEVGLSYTRLSVDAYSEEGIGARSFEDGDFDSLVGFIGTRVSTDFHSGATRITPQIRIGLEHEFEGDFEQVARFSAGGVPFTIETDDREDTRFRLGAGLEAALTDQVTIGFDYDGAFASDYHEHVGSLRARFAF